MFDIGLSQVNPCDEQLNLNIIDDVTYHEVIRTELKKETELQSKQKIENTKLALEALHHNLYISELELIFEGYSTSYSGQRCFYDYAARDDADASMAQESSLDETGEAANQGEEKKTKPVDPNN